MNRTATALALGSLLLYGPGILFPALHIEKLGRTQEPNILAGTLTLLAEGEWFLGLVVGLSALILPPFKLTVVLWLGAGPARPTVPTRLQRSLEFIGRFGLLEVFLSALLISLIKFDALVRIQPRLGLTLYALSALLSLLALTILSLQPRGKENVHANLTH